MRLPGIFAGVACVLTLAAGSVLALERVAVELTDGSKIEGELLKKDARVLYLGVADAVLQVEREKVKELRTLAGETESMKDTRQYRFYVTGLRPVKSVATHAMELGPAIVVVKTPSGLGTGWFCRPDGYVVTNEHVVSGERTITVTAYKQEDGRIEKVVYRKVRLVALDPDVDLALLKIEEDLGMEVPQLYLGDSAQLKEGDPTFTIGNPLGLERSTSEGIVSKVSRSFGGRLYVQTTAPISPGNSGGPLFNERGEVIGVTNMGYMFRDGLGFAIPSAYVKEFLDNPEAFAYDPDNPNAGMKFMETPLTATDGSFAFVDSDFVKAGHGVGCLTLADMDGDGLSEIVFVNNNKAEIGILKARGDEPPDAVDETDLGDINRLPESRHFRLRTEPVSNKISAIAVADANGDGRPDIVFCGDIDALAVLEQGADGTLGTARRIAEVDVARRPDALRIADLDGDGTQEFVVLGTSSFAVVREGDEPRVYPLDGRYNDRIVRFELVDADEDGRLDVLLFATDRFYATQVLWQNGDGEFAEGLQVRSMLAGMLRPYNRGAPGTRFLTLDRGQNRVRELIFGTEQQPVKEGRVNFALSVVPLDSAARSADDFELADLDGDGKLEILSVSRDRNEFVILQSQSGRIRAARSPAPKGVETLELFQSDPGRAALFCISPADKLFGVSRVRTDGVTYPRPINTDAPAEMLWLGKVDGTATVLWAEKAGREYILKTAPAAVLAAQVLDGGKGSIDIEPRTLQFSQDGGEKAQFRQKPDSLSFADFNGDGHDDVVLHWSYSGKESLYLGEGDGAYRGVIIDQEFLDEQKGQPLLTADVDGDGRTDVLLVQPGFVRMLRVDEKGKLYVERQFNWPHDAVQRMIPFGGGTVPRFAALVGDAAKVVEFDPDASGFRHVGSIDLAGLGPEDVDAGDVDGNGATDLVLLGGNALRILYARNERHVLRSRNVFDARLDTFNYWKVHPADLTGDGRDEVLLFDSRQSVFEVQRPDQDGELASVFRHRLLERSILQRDESEAYEFPQEVAVGDVDGDGKADLVCVLVDRIAIYLQGS